MEMFYCKDNLRTVKACDLFIKLANLGQMEEEFTSRTEFKSKVKFFVCLKGIFKMDYKWMLNVFKNKSLAKCMFNLILLNEVFLFKHFDGMNLLVILFTTQHDLAIRASPDDFQKFEIIDCHTLRVLFRIAFNVIRITLHIN